MTAIAHASGRSATRRSAVGFRQAARMEQIKLRTLRSPWVTLLKDRVADAAEFADAVERVAAGGTALDAEVVTKLMRASRQIGGFGGLTPREHEVLEFMAEGRSNAAIAEVMAISSGAVEKHVASIFGKLGLPSSAADNRRVLAVLQYLRA